MTRSEPAESSELYSGKYATHAAIIIALENNMIQLEDSTNWIAWDFPMRAWSTACGSLGILDGTELMPEIAIGDGVAASQIEIDTFLERNNALFWQLVRTQIA